MSQPMTGEEVKAAYAAGHRDFRGVDLRGADLAGAMLQGIRLGPQWEGTVFRGLIGGGVGAVAGTLIGGGDAICALALAGNKLRAIHTTREVFIAATFIFYGLLLKKSATTVAVAVAVAVGLAVAIGLAVPMVMQGVISTVGSVSIAIEMAITFTVAAGLAVAVAAAGAVAVAVAIPVAITVEVAFVNADAGVFARVNAASLASAAARSAARSAARAIPGADAIAVAVAVAVIVQLFIAWSLRGRALRGDPQHDWLRRLTLFIGSLGSTLLTKADLTSADLTGAQLRGADLRGTILRRTRFHEAHSLEWVHTSPGPLRSVPALHLLSSGNGTGRDYSGLDLSELDLSSCDLSRADLSGCDLRGTALPLAAKLTGATLQHARIDALTFQSSRATPDVLADWHERGVEIIALEAFPLPAQERIAGEREGLKLYFSARLGLLQKVLIEGVILGVLGPGTSCHYEYTVQGDLAVVRLFDAPRADLERVAEALHRRVWEQASEQTSNELAVLRGFLGHVDLRAGLSDLVQRLQRMTLRTEDAPASPAPAPTALVPRSGAALTCSSATTRWDWQRPTDPSGGQLALEVPLRVLLLFCAADRALADALHRHLKLLHNQGAIVLSRVDDLLPGAVIAAERAERLRSADALLVLLSGDLLADEDCSDLIAAALTPREGRALHLIPIPLHPCEWRTTALGKREPLPKDGTPIATATSRDGAFAEVASGLRRLALSQA